MKLPYQSCHATWHVTTHKHSYPGLYIPILSKGQKRKRQEEYTENMREEKKRERVLLERTRQPTSFPVDFN